MDAGVSPARQARAQHRHELRSLTYVTLDQANGGVVRNLTRDGIRVQAVAPVFAQHQLQVKFELRYPRLRVEARGEVVWATVSGQCGIRFLNLSPASRRQINEWVFGDLLEGAAVHSGDLILAEPLVRRADDRRNQDRRNQDRRNENRRDEDGGLMISATPLNVIELPMREAPPDLHSDSTIAPDEAQLDWLSQPLSGRALAWTVNTLIVFAAVLLFALVFLSVTREAPRWPFAMTAGVAVLVALMYWGFFQFFAGVSFGEKLARMTVSNCEDEDEERDSRFR